MTNGNAVRMILTFAIPLFIGNIFQQVYSMVDTMVAGYCLGDQAIAAIGATSSLYSLIIDLAWGLNSGFALIVTQAFGAHEQGNIRKSIGHMMVLDGIIAMILTVLALIFLPSLMRLMNTPEGIFDQAYSYIKVIFAGMLVTTCYNMFAGILRAFGNSRTPLYFLIFSSLLNIGLDLLFVAVFHMGVVGAALATVVAQAVSGVLTGIYVYRNYLDMMPTKEDFRLEKSLTKEMLATGGAMGFMYSDAAHERHDECFRYLCRSELGCEAEAKNPGHVEKDYWDGDCLGPVFLPDCILVWEAHHSVCNRNTQHGDPGQCSTEPAHPLPLLPGTGCSAGNAGQHAKYGAEDSASDLQRN